MGLANVRRKQLTEWSARFRLTGDRSARSKEFQKFWREKIEGAIDKRVVLTNVEATLIINDKAFGDPLFRGFTKSGDAKSLTDIIKNYLQSHPSDARDKQISDLTNIILSHLRQHVYNPLKANPNVIGPELQQKIRDVLSRLAASQEEVKAAGKLLTEYIKDLPKRPLGTFVYTNHRRALSSDYSEFKLLLQSEMGLVKLITNAGFSLYNTPSKAMNQQRVRDYSGALSLEGEAKNPFAQAADLSKITYAFTGRYERLKESKGMQKRRPDIAIAQFKLEIPFALGVSLPIALTYSSATEMSTKREARLNIGLNLDADKLYGLARVASK